MLQRILGLGRDNEADRARRSRSGRNAQRRPRRRDRSSNRPTNARSSEARIHQSDQRSPRGDSSGEGHYQVPEDHDRSFSEQGDPGLVYTTLDSDRDFQTPGGHDPSYLHDSGNSDEFSDQSQDEDADEPYALCNCNKPTCEDCGLDQGYPGSEEPNPDADGVGGGPTAVPYEQSAVVGATQDAPSTKPQDQEDHKYHGVQQRHEAPIEGRHSTTFSSPSSSGSPGVSQGVPSVRGKTYLGVATSTITEASGLEDPQNDDSLHTSHEDMPRESLDIGYNDSHDGYKMSSKSAMKSPEYTVRYDMPGQSSGMSSTPRATQWSAASQHIAVSSISGVALPHIGEDDLNTYPPSQGGYQPTQHAQDDDESDPEEGGSRASGRWDVDLRLKTSPKKKRRWSRALGFIDTGNQVGAMIHLDRVWALGFSSKEIDFNNMVEFDTLGGPVVTAGCIELYYRRDDIDLPQGKWIVRDFHILQRTLNGYDVWFTGDDDTGEPTMGEKPMAAGAILSKRKLTREEKLEMKANVKRQEEAAKQAEADRKRRKAAEKQKKKDENRHIGSSSAGASSSHRRSGYNGR